MQKNLSNLKFWWKIKPDNYELTDGGYCDDIADSYIVDQGSMVGQIVVLNNDDNDNDDEEKDTFDLTNTGEEGKLLRTIASENLQHNRQLLRICI